MALRYVRMMDAAFSHALATLLPGQLEPVRVAACFGGLCETNCTNCQANSLYTKGTAGWL